MMKTSALALLAAACCAMCCTALQAQSMIDLSQAKLLIPVGTTRVQSKAVDLLMDEIASRTGIRLGASSVLPLDARTLIVVARVDQLDRPRIQEYLSQLDPQMLRTREAYHIVVDQEGDGRVVSIVGNDDRGVLFGVGALLRRLHLSAGKILLPAELRLSSRPVCSLRGHQLGYRPKPNSYDGWTAAMWEQYIRDLIVFGANALELIPPKSDDAETSPHFPRPQMEMMIEMSRLADEYGLDVWVWYPALAQHYSDPVTVEAALREWAEVLGRLPRVDAVFVPGGDPGRTPPRVLLPFLEKQSASLRRIHPHAKMWVSPQSFSQAWFDDFVELIRQEPSWLTGVVYGPEVRVSHAELRRLVPPRYPIRDYPDITHSTHCQFPVPDWDLAFRLTHNREPINPRPHDMATIFKANRPHTNGFLCYSEGCNDDVNKMLWSQLGWSPDADVNNILRDYARYFIGPQFEHAFAEGLLGLEENWRGVLSRNDSIERTLALFQRMERDAAPRDLRNWRLQMALYRAYYDAYVARRLAHETKLEEQSLQCLRQARELGSAAVLAEAQAILDQAETRPVALDLRVRVFQLAEALFQSIRMQLSVSRYRALAQERGATLDSLEAPLNNRAWLQRQFASIPRLATEPERVAAIGRIVSWTDPGPDGFYDDLGNPDRQPRLVRGPAYESDPGFLRRSLLGVARRPWELEGWRLSWLGNVESMFDAPVEMEYRDLDPQGTYRVRVIYGGEKSSSRTIRLTADDRFEVHPFQGLESLTMPVEFTIPREATADGVLRLKWGKTPGQGGAGRGCQIAEVWLLKQPTMP